MEAYSLLEVNQYIERVLKVNFDEPIWMSFEINQVSRSRGNYYLTIIEKNDDTDEILAQGTATLWYRQYMSLQKKIGNLLEDILDDGIKVKAKVMISYSTRYGLSFNVLDIDPSYTLGQYELNRQKILERLKSEKLLYKNQAHNLPSVIQKIAVISSESAAGYKDFIEQLFNNIYGYDFDVTLFAAAMQGSNTESEVTDALYQINTNRIDYDIVVITRGGGSRLDLSSFDNYAIGKEIANCKYPVLTGIGHEIDETIADVVAHTILKTPTAVANFVIDNNMQFETEVIELFTDILSLAQFNIQSIKSALEMTMVQLNQKPKLKLLQTQLQLKNTFETISNSATALISNRQQSLTYLESVVKLIAPENILKRGFTLINQDGEYVTSANSLKTAIPFSIQFANGVINAKKIEHEQK